MSRTERIRDLLSKTSDEVLADVLEANGHDIASLYGSDLAAYAELVLTGGTGETPGDRMIMIHEIQSANTGVEA